MSTTAMHSSSIGASPVVKNNQSSFLNRIRTSFSNTQRPTFSSPPLSSSSGQFSNVEGDNSFDGKSMKGIGMDVRLRKRKSIFRRNGRNINNNDSLSSITALPPQLSLPIENEDVETSTEGHGGTTNNEKVPATNVDIRYTISTAASPKQRLEAHYKARLDVRRACHLLEQCSKEIKMRGLAMVGIFRPFRTSEDLEEVEKLIELYLLSSEPYLYQGVFGLDITLAQPSLLRDTLGKPDPEAEFRKRLAYANIHNVVALFKWGLRRLQLRLSDLRSTDQYSWYEEFKRKEKEQNYPIKAFSTILLPLLTNETSKLFKIVLDLMSTVAAHHFSNAMPAWKICKILGYWLFGRIGIYHEPINFQETYKQWEKSSKVMEHLLLVLIREQSSQFHIMPLRLTELIANYPFFDIDQTIPSLPPAFSSKNGKALFVEIKTENVIMTTKKPRKMPKEILDTSLKAENVDLAASEDVDDWMAIKSIASLGRGDGMVDLMESEEILIDEQNEPLKKNEELLLFKEEDARVLELAAEELQRRKDIYDGKSMDTNTEMVNNGIPTYNSASTLFSRPSDNSLFSLSNDGKGSISRSSSFANPGSGLGLAPLTETKDENFDWSTFSSSGFNSNNPKNDSFQLDKKFKPKTELEKVFEEQDRIEAIASEKKIPSSSRNGKNLIEKQIGEPKHVLLSVSSIEFDGTFASVWQDQLLDDCPAVRLPLLVCAQLNQRTSGALLGNAATFSFDVKEHWLVINETLIAPKQIPLHSSPTSTILSRRSSLWRSSHSRRTTGGSGGEGSSDDTGYSTLYGNKSRQFSHNSTSLAPEEDDRQSLFSIRSGFSTHFKVPANGLRKMKSMLSVRKDSANNNSENKISSRSEIWANGVESEGNGISGGRKESEIDAEVRELKAAVYADREKRKIEEAKRQKSKEIPEQISIISPSNSTTMSQIDRTPTRSNIKRKPAPLQFSESQDTTMTMNSEDINPAPRNGLQSQMEGSYTYSAQSSPTSKYLDAQD